MKDIYNGWLCAGLKQNPIFDQIWLFKNSNNAPFYLLQDLCYF